MTMTNFRLPSGVYVDMVAIAATDEAQFVSEYPTFQTAQGTEGRRGSAHGSWTSHTPQVPHHNDPLGHNTPVTKPAAAGGRKHYPKAQLKEPRPNQCLPLVSVSIDMQVNCTIAKTKLVQTFANYGSISIPEAWYSFPLYDGATVTAFRCEVGEDRVLEGKVKPKGEAQDEFKRAIKKQEAAALVEEMTPDVFQTTIGNIKPRSTVRIDITYVEELHIDLSGDGILVTIPTSVAPRYGTPPAGYTANSIVKDAGLSLVVSVASPDLKNNIVCRSGHGISIEYENISHIPEAASFEALAELQNQSDSDLVPNHAIVRLSDSQVAMDRDFVLLIPSSDQGLLRTRALLAPSNGSKHAAMMVTLSPNELFSDLQASMDEFDGEILFLADRSGSMTGSKIEGLRDALMVFLKSLPSRCKFNIYSFGTHVTSVWRRSILYNDSTVQQALDHVSNFEADFGGTEVLKALTKAVGDRRSTGTSSTQLILLTDGEIWGADKTIEFVRKKTSEAEGQLRFFSLGIGNRVSHQLIQGIGFLGGGFGEAVTVDAHGKWKEAVIRILRGAIMPKSWSYSISLGGEWKEKLLEMDDILPEYAQRDTSETLYRIPGAVSPWFTRAPRTIPSLHHFDQQSVYFLLDSTSDVLPEHVMITACSQYGGTKTATVAVTKALTNNETIRHLAAKAIVRDLESQDTSAGHFSKHLRKKAESLCQTYSITSKWTSFVAVNHLQQSAEPQRVGITVYKAPLAELDLLTRPAVIQAGANLPQMDLQASEAFPQHLQTGLLPPISSSPLPRLCLAPRGPSSASVRRLQQSERFVGGSSDDELSPVRFVGGAGPGDSLRPERDNSAEGQDTIFIAVRGESHMLSMSCPMDCGSTKEQDSVVDPHPGPGMEGKSIVNAAAPAAAPVRYCKGTSRIRWDGPNDDPRSIDWADIVRCQQADGLFDLDKILENRMAQDFCHGMREALRRRLEMHMEISVVERLVDTAMALSYLRAHFYSERALWCLLAQKAEGRLAAHFDPKHWSRRDVLSAMTDSALVHAHYARWSKEIEGDSNLESEPIHGCCDVCNLHDETVLSSARHDGRLAKCSFPECGVFVSYGDEFWAHAFEQDHILSSCESARDRYREAAAKAWEAEACRGGQKPKSIENQGNQDQSTTSFKGTKRMRTPNDYDDEVAGVYERRVTKRF